MENEVVEAVIARRVSRLALESRLIRREQNRICLDDLQRGIGLAQTLTGPELRRGSGSLMRIAADVDRALRVGPDVCGRLESHYFPGDSPDERNWNDDHKRHTFIRCITSKKSVFRNWPRAGSSRGVVTEQAARTPTAS